MAYLGFRCSNKDYTYVLLKGTKRKPVIQKYDNIPFPKGFTRSVNLKWFYQEIDTLIKKHKINCIAIKGVEGLARRSSSLFERIENEAIILLVAADNGIKYVVRKVKVTIAKDLGLKGKVKYLSENLDISVFPDFEKLNTKMKEALLVAWSSMK